MKTLKYTNANKAIDVEYLVDLIGSSDMLTVFQICQYVNEVKQVGLNGTAVVFGMPDTTDQVVSSDNSRVKHTLTIFKALAVSKNLTLQVFEDGQAVQTLNSLTALAITTEAIDGGNDATPYTFTFEATGGNAPYVWSTESTLPAGLTLSSAGVLSGTPTETGTFPLTIVVTDQFGVIDSLVDEDLVISA